jgi:hypothetical protein
VPIGHGLIRRRSRGHYLNCGSAVKKPDRGPDCLLSVAGDLSDFTGCLLKSSTSSDLVASIPVIRRRESR